MAFTDKQVIVTPLNEDHCATNHWSKQFMPQNQSLNILAHFYQKLQKSAKIEIGFLVTKMDVVFIIIIITSMSDLQPSTAIANQLPGH